MSIEAPVGSGRLNETRAMLPAVDHRVTGLHFWVFRPTRSDGREERLFVHPA